jgi:hypothetical protein
MGFIYISFYNYAHTSAHMWHHNYAMFEVLVTVTMQIFVFWDVTQCSLVDPNVLEEHALFTYPQDGGSTFL